jgi:hypothetical protein
MMRFIAVALCALVAGCADTAPVQKVVVQSDSYCRIAERIRWSRRDTGSTISQIRKHNARHRRICR